MKPSRFAEELIIGTCGSRRPCEAGRCVPQAWKAKYVGLEVSDAKRLRALEDENAKLKKLLAETMLDNAMLKGVEIKKMEAPAGRRE